MLASAALGPRLGVMEESSRLVVSEKQSKKEQRAQVLAFP